MSDRIFYLISGPINSGKSVFADCLRKFLGVRGHQIASFATPIYELVNNFGSEEWKYMSPYEYKEYVFKETACIMKPDGERIKYRECLQQVGSVFKDIFGEDVWVKTLLERNKSRHNLIIDDYRFPGLEDAYLAKYGQVYTFYIDGDRSKSKAQFHQSESNLDVLKEQATHVIPGNANFNEWLVNVYEYWLNNEHKMPDDSTTVSDDVDIHTLLANLERVLFSQGSASHSRQMYLSRLEFRRLKNGLDMAFNKRNK